MACRGSNLILGYSNSMHSWALEARLPLAELDPSIPECHTYTIMYTIMMQVMTSMINIMAAGPAAQTGVPLLL